MPLVAGPPFYQRMLLLRAGSAKVNYVPSLCCVLALSAECAHGPNCVLQYMRTWHMPVSAVLVLEAINVSKA